MSAGRRLLNLLVLCCVSAAVLAQETPDVIPDQNAGVRSEPVSLIFDSTRTIVNPGESLSLDCGVSGDYRYCHWEKGPTQIIQVQDVHDGVIDGMRKPDVTKGNECGIIINSVTIEDHGSWTCKVFVVGHTLTDTKNVTVTIRPTQPILEVVKPLEVNEGDEKQVSCSVQAARPRAHIHWWLGEEDLTHKSKTENSLTDDNGTYKSISTLRQSFKAWHNKKVLRCIVTHYTLESPVEDYVDVSVKYKPWGKDVRLYGIRMGDDVEAKINFSANPLPTVVKWGYGTEFDDIMPVLPVPGEEGRYSTEVVPLEDGHYSVILRVLEFGEMDAQLVFKVAVENVLGVRDFRVTISNEKPPNDVNDDRYDVVASTDPFESEEPLTSGTMAAIVIVVLAIILILLCAVYMRYNHLYCFAVRAESKAYIQDSEAPDFQHSIGAQNAAIKISTDQLNGNNKPESNVTTFNGNNGKATAIDHNDFTPIVDEKINTDV